MGRLTTHGCVVVIGRVTLPTKVAHIGRIGHVDCMLAVQAGWIFVAAGAVVGEGDAPGVGTGRIVGSRRTVVVALVGVTGPLDRGIGVGGVCKGSGPRYSEGPVDVIGDRFGVGDPIGGRIVAVGAADDPSVIDRIQVRVVGRVGRDINNVAHGAGRCAGIVPAEGAIGGQIVVVAIHIGTRVRTVIVAGVSVVSAVPDPLGHQAFGSGEYLGGQVGSVAVVVVICQCRMAVLAQGFLLHIRTRTRISQQVADGLAVGRLGQLLHVDEVSACVVL